MDVSERRQEGSDDFSTGILCDVCKGVGEDENAVCYCTACAEFLCDSCTKAHRSSRCSQQHQLLDKDSMCTKHYESVKYYCKIHDDCCCSVCAATEHTQCKVEHIDDFATEFEKSKEYTSLMSVIADLTQLLHNTKTKSMKKKDDLGRIHVKFVSDIKKVRTEINHSLDCLELSTLMQAHTVIQTDTTSTESVFTTCDATIADLEKMLSNIEKQTKYKQQRQLVISVKKAQTQIKQYDSITAELNNQCTIREYCFRPNETIIQFIKTANSLGQLDVRKKEDGRTHIEKKGLALEKVSALGKDT